MSTQRYTPEFKEEAVRQVVEGGYAVPEVAARLGASVHSLYKWVKAVMPTKDESKPPCPATPVQCSVRHFGNEPPLEPRFS
jgi:transposase-like protein